MKTFKQYIKEGIGLEHDNNQPTPISKFNPWKDENDDVVKMHDKEKHFFDTSAKTQRYIAYYINKDYIGTEFNVNDYPDFKTSIDTYILHLTKNTYRNGEEWKHEDRLSDISIKRMSIIAARRWVNEKMALGNVKGHNFLNNLDVIFTPKSSSELANKVALALQREIGKKVPVIIAKKIKGLSKKQQIKDIEAKRAQYNVQSDMFDKIKYGDVENIVGKDAENYQNLANIESPNAVDEPYIRSNYKIVNKDGIDYVKDKDGDIPIPQKIEQLVNRRLNMVDTTKKQFKKIINSPNKTKTFSPIRDVGPLIKSRLHGWGVFSDNTKQYISNLLLRRNPRREPLKNIKELAGSPTKPITCLFVDDNMVQGDTLKEVKRTFGRLLADNGLINDKNDDISNFIIMDEFYLIGYNR